MKKLMILTLALTIFCSYSDTKCTKKHNKQQRLEQKKQCEHQEKQQSKKLKKQKQRQKQRQKKRTVKKVFLQAKKVLEALATINSAEDKEKAINLSLEFAEAFPVQKSSKTSFDPYENAEECVQDVIVYIKVVKRTLKGEASTILSFQNQSFKKTVLPAYNRLVQAVRPAWLSFAKQETQRLIKTSTEIENMGRRLDKALLGEALFLQKYSIQEEEETYSDEEESEEEEEEEEETIV